MEETPVQKGTEKTAKDQAQAILNSIRKGKDIHDVFVDNFRRQYLIANQTIEQWEKKFKITVPANPDPAVCKSLDMKIMELHQDAAFYHASASAAAQILRKGNDSQYRARHTAMVEELRGKGKLPAAKLIEDLVRAETDDIESAVANAELQEKFWSDIMDHLAMLRRLLENATINSGIQQKMDSNHKGNIYT
jgi:hypothetical protein